MIVHIMFKHILLLGLLACPGMFQIFLPGCEPEVMTNATLRCYNISGVPYDEVSKNISQHLTLSIHADFYTKQCASKQNYTLAKECIKTEFERCSMEDSIPTNDAFQWSLCDDPRVNFTCLAQADRHYPELTNCVETKITQSINHTTMTWQEQSCRSMKIATDCRVDMIRRCDSYTADQISLVATSALPPICQSPSAIIG
uniref:DUF19 domain-containing protein n=1 Tax=Biomphalaria glabrata TaxID=6526 RepID=A0A2C9KHQ2_BIOGL